LEQYLTDTNVVSDYFSASFPSQGMAFMDSTIDAIPNRSIITQIELLCWKTDALTEQNVKDFISDSVIFPISPEVIDQCVKLRKAKNKITGRYYRCNCPCTQYDLDLSQHFRFQ